MTSKTKKVTPPNSCWVIYDPENGLFYKQTIGNARNKRWVRYPWVYGTESHLMRTIESIRTTFPTACVVPYQVDMNMTMPVGSYGL